MGAEGRVLRTSTAGSQKAFVLLVPTLETSRGLWPLGSEVNIYSVPI